MSEFKARRYACVRWPFLRLRGGVKFSAGFYTAKSEDEVKIIEENQAFGVHIHPILWEPSKVPTTPGKVEALIESEIESALAIDKPRARRGAIGTRGARG